MRSLGFSFLLAWLMLFNVAQADVLDINAPAPRFELQDQNGDTHTLNDYQGKWLVLYFYPKDDTPGCTKEAIGFTENIKFFNDNNITVIGISKDTVEKHDKFINKYNLDIVLGSDVNGKACESFGVWVEKSMYGRKYMGIERTTFLVSADGTIYKIWNKVKVKDHIEDVLKSSREMLQINS